MPPLHPLEVDQSYADVGERRQSPKVFNIPSLDAPIQFQVYSGQSVFLVASGPSFRKIDSTQLSQPGIVSMGVNNSPKSFRPNLWVSVDNPHKFLRSIWIDPQITKFVRETHLNETLFDSSHWTPTRERPSDCPNVISFCSSVEFDASSYLSEDTVCWGNSIERGSGRSVLLAALKILYSLGFQHVFLVGVDFEMKPARPYHFDENCSNDHSYSNQRAYEILSGMLESLQPHFLERNFFVWNCNPDSGLKAFPFFSLENAIEFALRKFPKDLSLERTEGLYQRTPGGNDSMDSPKAQNEIPITAGGMSRISRKRRSIQVEAEELPVSSPEPEKCGIVAMGNETVEWLLPWWLRNLRLQNPEISVHIVDLGFSTSARKWLSKQNVSSSVLELDSCYSCPWFMKPRAIASSPFQFTVFLDLDCEVRSSLDKLFSWSTRGLVMGKDRYPFSNYGKLFRRDHFFNSGVIAVHQSHVVIPRWIEATEHLHDKLRGDQEILNLTIYENEIPVVVLPEHFHQLRLDGDHPEAKIMHWTGEAGKAEIQNRLKGSDSLLDSDET